MHTARRRPEITPVEAAHQLVESLASEFEFEESQEREFEIADRLAVAWGRSTLVDRLWFAKGEQVCVHVDHRHSSTNGCGIADVMSLGGCLVDLGPDWFVMESRSEVGDQTRVIIPLNRLRGVQGLSERAAPQTAQQSRGKIWSRRKLTQLLRPLADESQLVRVHSDLGCSSAKILRVGVDHCELEYRDVPSRAPRIISLSFEAISAIEAELGGS